MSTYLLNWNPDAFEWTELDDAIEEVRTAGAHESTWTTGVSRSIEAGARFFLIRQGPEPRGLVGSGTFVTAPSEQPHWLPERAAAGDTSLRAKVSFDALRRFPVLDRRELDAEGLADFRWDTQASGVRVPDEIAARLEPQWQTRLREMAAGESPLRLPEDVVARWRDRLEQRRGDAAWTERQAAGDRHREAIAPEISTLIADFRSDKIDLAAFRETLDRKTRKDWDGFGLKGASGAMFVNKLAKHLPSAAGTLAGALAVPASLEHAGAAIDAFMGEVKRYAKDNGVRIGVLQVNRAPFLISACWHVQAPTRWPAMYRSAVEALQTDGLLGRALRGGSGYFAFARLFRALADALDVDLWALEHLLEYQRDHDRQAELSERGTDDPGAEEVDEEADVDDLQQWFTEVILGSYDSAEVRDQVVRAFVSAVKQASGAGEATWAVTQRPRRFRLLVGETVAFELGRGEVGVGLHLATLPAGATGAFEPDTGREDFSFARVEGGCFRHFTAQKFLALEPQLRPALDKFIELANLRYSKSPFARHHVPELLRLLEAATGETLPRPTHAFGRDAPSYWKISPGEKARLWGAFRDGGYVAIGWDELGDLQGVDREGFEARVADAVKAYPSWKPVSLGQLWRFINIPVGARVVANDGKRRVVGIGTVTGPYRFVDDGEEYAHRLPVRWDDTKERVVDQPGWSRSLIRLTRETFDAVASAPAKDAEGIAPPPVATRPQAGLDFGGLIDRLSAEGLHFSTEAVASYLLALQAKRFVILSGISGTGKTRLALEVAKAFAPAEAPESPAEIRTHEVVAVRPDWTDNRGLLGFYNPITREYQPTPFLRLLLAAADNASAATRDGEVPLPFFAILDEMNLARVEHYFSDFLSCLESGEPLHLHDDPLVAEGASGGVAIPTRLEIPANLFFTGTVNVDETTYMFSPKVLDRGFVLEFNDVDLVAFGGGELDQAEDADGPLHLGRFEGEIQLAEARGGADWEAFRELDGGGLFRAVVDLHRHLQPDNRHFGYRVANEIARFVDLARAQAGAGEDVLRAALDVAILAKVLPKLHGTQQEIEGILERLFDFCATKGEASAAAQGDGAWDYLDGALRSQSEDGPLSPVLPRSATKLWRMLRRVRQQGYVSFIG